MPSCPALHAHFLPTLTHLLLLTFLLLERELAPRPRTPHQRRIRVDLHIFLEPFKLHENLFRSELLDTLCSETLITTCLHTWDLLHFSIGDVRLQVVCQTFFAELVPASQAEELFLFEFFAAYVALTE